MTELELLRKIYKALNELEKSCYHVELNQIIHEIEQFFKLENNNSGE